MPRESYKVRGEPRYPELCRMRRLRKSAGFRADLAEGVCGSIRYSVSYYCVKDMAGFNRQSGGVERQEVERRDLSRAQ